MDREGLTNDIELKEDVVIKHYKKYPFTSFLQFMTYLLAFRFNFPSRTDRIKNEITIKAELDKLGINTPDIIKHDEDTIHFRKISGSSGYHYLKTCSNQEAKELGANIQDILNLTHENNISLKDCRLTNFIINQDKIYSIDHEYSTTRSNIILKQIDKIIILASARHSENYDCFKKGFFKEQDPLKFLIVFMSFFASIFLFLITDRGFDTLKTILKSTK